MLFHILISFLILFVIFYFWLRHRAYSIITPYTLSDYTFSKITTDYTPTGSIFDEPTIYLSIIVPAYKEEKRIRNMLDVTLEYLEKRRKKNESFTYEIIIVDDGSTDDTANVVEEYIKEHDKGRDIIRLLKLLKNRGKGFAVKQGVIRARGEMIMFCDADGATDIHCFDDLEYNLKKIQKGEYGIAIGSRAHLESNIKRTFFRNLVGTLSKFLTRFVAGIHVAIDTQCGFKLFTRETAKILFLNLCSDRWCFDIDLLHMAQELNIPVVEVPVKWEDVEGSKLTLFGMAQTARDLLLVRLYYLFNFWKVDKNVSKEKFMRK